METSSSRRAIHWLFFLVFVTRLTFTNADGVGILGAGKWLYRPTCAHACRRLIATNPLLCDSGQNSTTHDHSKRHSHGGPTTKECFLKDKSYLRTQALCMAEYCPRDNVPTSELEFYWEGHLATGTVGDWSLKPFMSYSQALMLAQEDVERVGKSKVPFAISGQPLNQTSFITEKAWVKSYNGQASFDIGEHQHGRNSLAVSITSVSIPILVSFLRFLPGGKSGIASRISAIFDQPAWGKNHRVPGFGKMGLVPTRGQALFIVYLIFVNAFLTIFPYHLIQPNYIAPNPDYQRTMIFGDRAGVLAEANWVALFLFSSRNNVLLWVTNWSHSTYLLVHRWIAYISIIQACVHSALMLYIYAKYDDYYAELVKPYWYWGIVATIATTVMWPAALLPIRRRFYEGFLVTHQVLAALTLIGTFLHIWYLFEYKWGYEIWVYIAGGIWGLDRLVRILRLARNGIPTATITALDSTGEYLRVDIDGIVSKGHVYVYFPTLSWRFWESHPFSVLSTFTGSATPQRVSQRHSPSDIEKTGATTGIASQEVESSSETSSQSSSPIRPRTTLLLRAQTGTTIALAKKVLAAGGTLTVPSLIESSYHSNPGIADFEGCSTLIGIAGGVGITAVLPVLRTFAGIRAHLYWGVRNEALVQTLEPDIRALDSRVEVETSIGQRLAIADLLTHELSRNDVFGDVAVLVCGPSAMADEVRRVVGDVVGSGRAKRGVVFVDEAFSW
ncbi:ferric reductase transmembrane component 4 [Dendryphion nanum]|uniref:Ferric reductase transmembrane component 4 n=1 Tax=Dendryphion nanum TaxID=256645 RepID=A0A9P9IB59_9PLEO|nr:ferric reductase transmembrane component 4 [Dendryphion nanum]